MGREFIAQIVIIILSLSITTQVTRPRLKSQAVRRGMIKFEGIYMEKITALGIIIALSTIVVVSDILLMYSTKAQKNQWLLIIVAIIYLSEIPFWFLVMKVQNLSSLAVVYSVIVMFGLIIGGVLLFKDEVTAYKMVGFALGIIAVILMEV
jgi:multidrug transporter EmrE-like cation transporter